ncbi:MAG: VacJ family lipoprotein [Syntrophobacteraceae bacterium]|nr:VacJ family lipoprotein [Syntrophobacteraceae bacterium]
MRKIACFEVKFTFLLIFAVLAFPILAGAQIFTNQQRTESASEGQVRVQDPFERSNRKIFNFNDRLYSKYVRPVTNVYSQLPITIRNVFHNGFENLEDPSRFVNFVLQQRPRMAGNTMTRFVINSTVGVGGMFDVAKNALGVERHNADFGQTLGVYGVDSGPYLVVPALGPSDTRDLLGFAVDSVMDPLFWVPGPFWITYPPDFVKYMGKAADHIDDYETMKKAALDPYVAMRDGYMQYRKNAVSKK